MSTITGSMPAPAAWYSKLSPMKGSFPGTAWRLNPIALYIPGKFYRRELPCILKVYGRVKEEIDLLLVDGYVFLENDRKGLGGHLFEALRGKTPVIGVAKSFYRGCRNYREVYRGKSGRPLFVSSIGVPLPYAAELIKNLKGR